MRQWDEGIAFVDAESNEFTWVNDFYAELLRTSPDSLIGKTWIEYTPKPYDERDLQLVQEVLDGKREHYQLSKLYVDTWRQEVPVTITVHALRAHGKRLVAFFVRCKPATDVLSEGLRRVEEQISGMQKLQRSVLPAASDESDRRIGALVRKHGIKAAGILAAFIGSALGAVYALGQVLK